MDREAVIARHTDSLRSFLSPLDELKVLELGLPEQTPPPRTIWSQFSGLQHWPTVMVKRPAQQRDVLQKLTPGVKGWELGDTLWLSVGGMGSVWAHVEILGPKWLEQVWDRLSALEIVILAEDFSRGVSITEEEYEIYLYILDPGPQPGVFQIRR